MLVYCSEVQEAEAERLHHDQPHRRAGADGGEQQNQHAHEQRCWRPAPGGSRSARGCAAWSSSGSWRRGLRHHQQARLDRREAQAHLVEQRQQERDAADAEAREEAAAHRGAKGADAKQRQPQQRMRGARARAARTPPAARPRSPAAPQISRPRSADARRTPPARTRAARCRSRTDMQADDVQRGATLSR